MASPVWFLIASLFLVSINGKAIYENGTPSYYEKIQYSSPAPPSAAPSENKLAGMKELVLYLTPDQVQVLEAAGAVVKPFPQFEKAFLQKQQQQSVEEQTEAQNQADTSSEDAKQDPELEEFYKVLNIQQINEDLGVRGQSAEQSSEKPRQKYKYTLKPRLQDYASLYVQKKANRNKPYSTEYVRYLPNYEIENLKMESYRAKPVPGYSFESSLKAQENLEIAKYLLTEAPEIKKSKENPQNTEELLLEEEAPKEPERTQLQVESPVEIYSPAEDKGPVTFESRVQEPAKEVKSTNKPQFIKVWEPISAWQPAKIQEESEEIETLTEEELIAKIKAKSKVQEEKPKKSSVEIERQLSSLLAPLLKHKIITESIAKEKEALANNEKEIQNKLKELKDSGKHDEKQYATELRKLNENLEKQNALAEKLAKQGVIKEPEVVEKVEEEAPKKPTEPKKTEKVNDPTPVVIRIPDSVVKPQFYPVTLDILRSLPASVLKTKKVEEQKPAPEEKRIRLPEPGTVYYKFDKPYIVQQPDNLSILRHIWEH